MPARIREGDLVAVISGADRGKRGRVLRVIVEKERVIVEGVKLVYKHLRRSQANPQGGRVRREAAIHMSNVQPVDPESNKPTRIANKLENGRRVRVGRRTGVALGAQAGKAGRKGAPKGAKKED